jgi:glycosyltransferase 2 family protein
VDGPLLAVSVVAHVGVLAWGVWVWSRVQDRFEHAPVRFTSLLRFWFLSNLARYVPGLQFIAVAQMSGAEGHRRLVMVASLLAQTGLALLSALVIGAWTLGGRTALGAVPLGLAASGLAVAVMHPGLLNWGLDRVSQLARREPVRWNGSWMAGVEVLGLTCLSWLVYGVAYYLFLRSLTPLPVALLPQLTGVNALSFAAGLVAVVVPGGIGPREGAMTWLLTPYLPAGVAALLAAASRLWSVLAELLGGGLSLLAGRARR